MQPFELTASEASALIAKRELSCEELARSTLDHIVRTEPDVRAFTYVDADQVVRNARELDKTPPKSPLHGLTFGVKDMIDTVDMPTTYNSPIYYGHQAGKDAACVGTVRARGALILGKTDTVEFATGGRRAATRNPYNFAHTPGGSSSGSGAAVSAKMVQLAFGTQTGGSHIRPAAFNGIYGIKPTHGVVSREGAKNYSHTLDTIGWYGRSVADLQLVAREFRLFGMDEAPTTPLKGLKVGLCRGPNWHLTEASGRAALMTAAARLAGQGAEIVDLDLPPDFDHITHAQEVVMRGEGRAAFLPDYLANYALLHQDFRDLVENAKGYTAEDMVQAYDLAASCRRQFDGLFGDALDVVLTPPCIGQAPIGYYDTGNPAFNSMWTLLHVPCVAIPVGLGDKGLPVGIQVIGPRFSDARLLSIASACAPAIHAPAKLTPVDATMAEELVA
jgi:Asp-tRNA(Asn)/Glu-tRNA(Gln) amidotransferase A subunit family amidase